jgi:hypothetical protein
VALRKEWLAKKFGKQWARWVALNIKRGIMFERMGGSAKLSFNPSFGKINK